MTARSTRSLVGVLLAFWIGAQLLEVSGRWDRTFQDANDEAGVAAIALCVGIAIALAGTLPARVCFSRRIARILDVPLRTTGIHLALTAPSLPGSPPTALRI